MRGEGGRWQMIGRYLRLEISWLVWLYQDDFSSVEGDLDQPVR